VSINNLIAKDMSRTQTIFVDLSRLLFQKEKASLIIRLMMAGNDISLANQCLSKYKEDHGRMSKHAQRGALMYFVRLQCGHLKEAMDLVQEICDDQDLYDRINRCSTHAQGCFDNLKNCLNGGPDHKKFKDYVMKVRHKTVFHYDRKLVERALEDRANRQEARTSHITRGDHITLWRFNLADDIVDSIICRHIWKIPRKADLRQQADQIADFGSNLCVSFLDFCGEFIFSYIQENAAI
jgi:hypothetical protein